MDAELHTGRQLPDSRGVANVGVNTVYLRRKLGRILPRGSHQSSNLCASPQHLSYHGRADEPPGPSDQNR
jgi:hypothetical protein